MNRPFGWWKPWKGEVQGGLFSHSIGIVHGKDVNLVSSETFFRGDEPFFSRPLGLCGVLEKN